VNFFRVARASVFECCAIVDLSLELGFIDESRKIVLEDKLVHIGKSPSGLIRYVEKLPARDS